LSFSTNCPAELSCTPFVRQRRPGDVAAHLFQPLAVVRFDPHGGVQTEAVDVGTQGLPCHTLARHRAPEGPHLLPGTGPEGAAVRDGRGLQRPQRARLVPVGIGLGQTGLPHLLDQHAPARGQLNQGRDEGLQQSVQLVVSGRNHLDKHRHAIAIAIAPVHPVQHRAVKVDVEVGGRAEALDQREGAALALVGLEPGAVQQVARNHALDHLLHRRDQLGLLSQKEAQVCDIRRAPHDGRNPRRLQLKASSLPWPHSPQRSLRGAVRQDAALQQGVELVLDEPSKFGPGAGFAVGNEFGRVILHQAV